MIQAVIYLRHFFSFVLVFLLIVMRSVVVVVKLVVCSQNALSW